jgi:hypothetical protein
MSAIPTVGRSSRGEGVGAFWLWGAAILLVWAGTAFYLVVKDPPVLLVVVPLVAVVVILLWFLWAIARRRGDRNPVFEIGAVYALAVSLYVAYPLTGFLVNRGHYGPYNDVRLFVQEPTTVETGKIAWFFIVHLLAFVAIYRIARGRRVDSGVVVPPVGRLVFWGALLFWLAVEAYFVVLSRAFNLSAGSYEESYLVYSRLPLLLAQISGHLVGIRFTAELIVLAFLFTRYRRSRWLIAGLLGFEAISAAVRLGSRTELVLLLFASAMLYHLCVRRIKLWKLALCGTLGVVAFLAFGIVRSYGMVLGTENPLRIFSFNSEFDALFANALDIHRRKATGEIGRLPAVFFYSDLLAVIPQQLLPFTKISPPIWYVNTFYPAHAEQGGGLAFGTIAQSLVGAGWIDLILRGGALGFFCGRLHAFHAARRGSFWVLVSYVWATIWVYQSFRNTTFSVLTLFVYRFLPVMLALLSLRFLGRLKESEPMRSGWSRAE